jgi:hypothetical protein
MDRVRVDSAVVSSLAVMLSSACLFSGCMTTAVQETARTAPRGGFEGGVSLTPVFFALGPADRGLGWTPAAEWYSKFGLSDNFDLGLRFGNGSGGLIGKYRLMSDGVEVAARLGASLGVTLVGSLLGSLRPAIAWGSVSPRVIASREPEHGLPWAFSVGLDYNGLTYPIGEARAGTDWLDLKAGVGLPYHVHGAVRLMPEIGLALPLVGSLPHEEETEFLPGGSAELSLGITFAAIAARNRSRD